MDGVHREIGAFLRSAGVGRARPLLVAASGGADSTALLLAFAALGLRLCAAHVHHGLRGPEADADLEFVRALAARLGIPFRVAHVDAARRDGRSPEARARVLRYAALESLRQAAGCAWIATAHTLDDQAETLLLRALHGTSLAGLAGIEPVDRRRRLLRPLLALRRDELRRYLIERGQAWRTDASNADLALARNRLRAEVMPVLQRVEPRAVPKLAQLADAARAWAAPRRTRWEEALDAALEPGEGGEWLPLEALRALRESERGALLAAWMRRGPVARLSHAHVERARGLAQRGPTGRTLSLPGDAVLFRDRDALWLGPAPGPRFPAPLERWLAPPRGLECPERDLRLVWRALEAETPGAEREEGWAVGPGSSLRVRSPRPGDVVRIDPACEPRPLRELFARAAWPRRRRARTVVVEQDGRVVWIPGLVRATPAHTLRHGWKLVIDRLSTTVDSC